MRQLNLIGPINKLSYGYVTANVLRALTDAGIKVALFPVNNDLETEPHHIDYVVKAVDNAKRASRKAATLVVWHHHGLAQYRKFNGPHFGFPIFETNVFNDAEITQLEAMDGLFVTCRWYQDIIENFTTKPVHIAHLGVDAKVFNDIEELKIKPYDKPKVRFFNAGKWEIRKGHDIIPEVFAEAFEGIDDVSLTMCCDNLFLTGEDNQRWRDKYKAALADKVMFVDRLPSQAAVANLMRIMDFGFFPARAEGWNMELHEMLWLGKPCVTTNVSAHTAYANKKNSFLVDVERSETSFDGHFFFGQGSWASFGLKERNVMVEGLRRLYHYKRGNPGSLPPFNFDSVRTLTWDATAKQLIAGMGLNG